jgi:hypothetical protein
MSIYSGFGTRQQETAYNTLVESTIKLLQGKVLSNLQENGENDSLFKMQLLKNYDLLLKLEAHKYLLPRFSESIKKLVLSVIKEQVGPRLEETKESAGTKPDTHREERENLKKSATAFLLQSAAEGRSATPTLPVVRNSRKVKNLTPVKGAKAETGFLYARLTSN